MRGLQECAVMASFLCGCWRSEYEPYTFRVNALIRWAISPPWIIFIYLFIDILLVVLKSSDVYHVQSKRRKKVFLLKAPPYSHLAQTPSTQQREMASVYRICSCKVISLFAWDANSKRKCAVLTDQLVMSASQSFPKTTQKLSWLSGDYCYKRAERAWCKRYIVANCDVPSGAPGKGRWNSGAFAFQVLTLLKLTKVKFFSVFDHIYHVTR